MSHPIRPETLGHLIHDRPELTDCIHPTIAAIYEGAVSA